MLAIGLLVAVMAIARGRLGRIEGSVLLVSFVLFIAVVAQNATL